MATAKTPFGAASVFRVARPSTVDLISIELRNAIFSGALPVGGPIGEVEIATQLGVSRSPLREAAQRLVQEGLLTATPGRGLRVSVIGTEHLQDLYDARGAVEFEAVRIIVRDKAALDQVAQALDELEKLSEGQDARAIGDADLAFHRALVEASGNRRLSRYMATLAIETRIASFSTSDEYIVRRDVSPTYRALLKALRAGDVDTAIAALQQQFDEAVARLSGDLEPEKVQTITEAITVPPVLQPLDVAGAPE
ncbi:GntR family transcriptional regulator [Microbacterium protaetiae]|uniref:GntR family transcriptional regulator n=1 Tax=Microbacterium protaetiae TaxID=2509458 RepID=A0A4P6EDI6_9MICO|nr:GntR family transcriptional regulator [Microbacterium protaetiae]QAY60322.1 GntR family transcriptional regulator [Microbacterium protaetiae]